jgi:hypothetical protein
MSTKRPTKNGNDFESVFRHLSSILQKHAGELSVKEDSATCFCLEGGRHPTQKMPMSIAWVQICKAYVGYHLMTVYGCPALLNVYSKELKARMQGKSCCNFTAVDEPLFEELERLTVEGFVVFKKAGFMS